MKSAFSRIISGSLPYQSGLFLYERWLFVYFEKGSFHVQYQQRSFLCHSGYFPASIGALFLLKRVLFLWERTLYIFYMAIFILSMNSILFCIIQGSFLHQLGLFFY